MDAATDTGLDAGLDTDLGTLDDSPPAAPVADAASARSPVRLWRSPVIVTVGCAVAFVVIQAGVEAARLSAEWRAYRGGATAYRPEGLSRYLVAGEVSNLVLFAGLLLAGIVLARQGHRLLCVAPAVAYIVLPVLIVDPGGVRVPHPVGEVWGIWIATQPWWSSLWAGAAIDLVLITLPALAFASSAPRWQPRPQDAGAIVASTAVCLALAALAVHTDGVVTGRPPTLAISAAIAVFGAGIGWRRPWWPWLIPLVAVMITGLGRDLVWSRIAPDGGSFASIVRYGALETIPITVAGLAAGMWEVLAVGFERMGRRPVTALALVNALNAADAALTAFAIHAGVATELNPFVRVLGLPLKIVAVGALSWLLYRRRPAALVSPAAALLVVLAYHLSGVIVNKTV